VQFVQTTYRGERDEELVGVDERGTYERPDRR